MQVTPNSFAAAQLPSPDDWSEKRCGLHKAHEAGSVPAAAQRHVSGEAAASAPPTPQPASPHISSEENPPPPNPLLKALPTGC